MPALTGIEEKYFNGYKVDKENENTIYSDEQHVYIDKASNQKCISVTTLIGKYENEFDEDFWSSYKALEEMMDGDVWSIVREALLNKKMEKSTIFTFFMLAFTAIRLAVLLDKTAASHM